MNGSTVCGEDWRAARKALVEELTRLRDQFSRQEGAPCNDRSSQPR